MAPERPPQMSAELIDRLVVLCLVLLLFGVFFAVRGLFTE